MLTVLFAVLAAMCNALSSVLQRRGARSVPTSKSMRLALALTLARRPVWLLGLVALAFAFVFQAVSLRHGELALVQPIMLAELPLTLLIAWALFKWSAERRAWVGVIGMCGGLAAVLAAAAPRGGRGAVGTWPIVLMSLSCVGLSAALVMVALRLAGPARAAAFGAAAGTGFALTAALMKEAMSHLDSHGFPGLVSSWELYAMVVAGATSLFLWQNALQAATLVAAQPAITLSDPVLSMFIGVLVFGERIRLGGWLAIELLGMIVIGLASIELARSPLLGAKSAGTTSRRPRNPATQPDPL